MAFVTRPDKETLKISIWSRGNLYPFFDDFDQTIFRPSFDSWKLRKRSNFYMVDSSSQKKHANARIIDESEYPLLNFE